jgi:HlyD family secretion protein
MSRGFVVTEVHESDIGRLVETGRLSQDADITADAYPGRRFRGKVVQITPRGISDAKVINFNVKVEVVGEGKELLLPKMTADVRILANATRNALLLPNQCLHYDRDQAFVEIKCPQGFARKPVKLGLNDGTQAEVLEGLCEGDEVAQGSSIVSHWLNATAGTATTQPGAGQPKTDEAKAPPAAPPAASTRESQP